MPVPTRRKSPNEAKNARHDEMGTLGSGNHYLEVQRSEIYDAETAEAFGIAKGDINLTSTAAPAAWATRSAPTTSNIWSGRQPRHRAARPRTGLRPINSPVGQSYLGAMRAASTVPSPTARS